MEKKFKNVYDFLKELIRITKSIRNIYYRLHYLESIGKKNSEEYLKNLDYLKIAIEVEDEIYNLCPDYRKSFEAIGEVMKAQESKRPLKKFDGILLESDDELIKNRIQDTLFNKITFGKSFEQILQRSFNLVYFNEKLIEKIQETISIYDAIATDAKRFSLYFIDEAQETKENKMVKKQLLKSFYNIVFTDKRMELDLLSNQFNLSRNLYFNSDLAATFSEVDNETFQNMKDKYGTDILVNTIIELLEINDDEYFNENNTAKGLILQSIIRAFLLIVGEDSVFNIQEGFNKYIESNIYVNDSQKHYISENLIRRAFDGMSKDRQKAITLKTIS